jgi:hypothetical protein
MVSRTAWYPARHGIAQPNAGITDDDRGNVLTARIRYSGTLPLFGFPTARAAQAYVTMVASDDDDYAIGALVLR